MLSTPLICCSSGVATDCSIVTASAPVYVVLTIICGGTMSGNCATGNPRIATRPPMTVTMAMTIATIGRLMKSFEIIYYVLIKERGLFFLSLSTRIWLRIYNNARPDLLRALSNHGFTFPQSIFDHPHRAHSVANLNGADFD